jgi:hypothetical protein
MAGVGTRGEQDGYPSRYASKTARIPVMKMPSKVPAPPMDATGAPRP